MRKHWLFKTVTMMMLVFAIIAAGCSQANQNAGQKADDQPTASPTQDPQKDAQPKTKFPEKPITLIVGVDAGGAGDVTARTLIPFVEKHLPNQVKIVVENKPGAAQTIAASEVAHAKPDGYTIAQLAAASLTIKPILGETDYKLTDLQPVANLYDSAQLIMVPASSPYQTFEEWLDYVKANPGKFRMGISGVGNAQHIALEDFSQKAGIQLNYVIYKSDGETLTNLLGNHIDGGTLQHMTVKEYVEGKQLRPLVNISGVKPDYLQDIATLKEKGFDAEGVFFNGIMAPAGVPQDVLDIISNAYRQALEDPQLIEEFGKLQAIINYRGPDDFKKMLDNVSAGNEKVLKGMGLLK